MLRKQYRESFGRTVKEPEMMFKLLFLKKLYDLSDETPASNQREKWRIKKSPRVAQSGFERTVCHGTANVFHSIYGKYQKDHEAGCAVKRLSLCVLWNKFVCICCLYREERKLPLKKLRVFQCPHFQRFARYFCSFPLYQISESPFCLTRPSRDE